MAQQGNFGALQRLQPIRRDVVPSLQRQQQINLAQGAQVQRALRDQAAMNTARVASQQKRQEKFEKMVLDAKPAKESKSDAINDLQRNAYGMMVDELYKNYQEKNKHPFGSPQYIKHQTIEQKLLNSDTVFNQAAMGANQVYGDLLTGMQDKTFSLSENEGLMKHYETKFNPENLELYTVNGDWWVKPKAGTAAKFEPQEWSSYIQGQEWEQAVDGYDRVEDLDNVRKQGNTFQKVFEDTDTNITTKDTIISPETEQLIQDSIERIIGTKDEPKTRKARGAWVDEYGGTKENFDWDTMYNEMLNERRSLFKTSTSTTVDQAAQTRKAKEDPSNKISLITEDGKVKYYNAGEEGAPATSGTVGFNIEPIDVNIGSERYKVNKIFYDPTNKDVYITGEQLVTIPAAPARERYRDKDGNIVPAQDKQPARKEWQPVESTKAGDLTDVADQLGVEGSVGLKNLVAEVLAGSVPQEEVKTTEADPLGLGF